MKNSMKVVLFLFLLCGAFGADEDEVKSVEEMEGDSVTLNPDPTKIREFNKIQWSFENAVIAQARKTHKSSYENNEKFIDRLELDNQNGSLTIKNMRTKHSGLYNLQIDNSHRTLNIKFRVRVYESPLEDVYNLQIKNKSVIEGDTVTLQTEVTESHGNELIVWRFGDAGKRIAKADMEAKNSLLYETDERFKDRLQLENKTGSLIITNSKTTDSGHYTVKISSNNQTLYMRFTVFVSAVPKSGLPSGAVPGIVGAVLLTAVAIAVAVVVIYRQRKKIAEELSKQLSELSKQLKDLLELLKDLPKTSEQLKKLLVSIEQLLEDHKEFSEERMKELSEECERLKKFLNGCETLRKTSESSEILKEFLENNFSKQIQNFSEKLKNWSAAVTTEVKIVSVKKGEIVTLKPEAKIKKNDEIKWLFGDEEKKTIATAKGGDGKIEIFDSPFNRYGACDTFDRFSGSLVLEPWDESLVILGITAEQVGLYELKITHGNKTRRKFFNVVLRDDEDPYVNVNEEETGRQMNESATVVMPLLNGEDLADDQEGTSSL